MTFILPCALIQEVLGAAGFEYVRYDKMDAEFLSVDLGVFLEQIPGSTPHIEYVNRPSIQILTYANDDSSPTAGPDKSLRASYDIQAALNAARGTPFSEGGIHRVLTRVDPYRQDIAGLPYGCGRTVAQYDFILSNKEKWS